MKSKRLSTLGYASAEEALPTDFDFEAKGAARVATDFDFEAKGAARAAGEYAAAAEEAVRLDEQ